MTATRAIFKAGCPETGSTLAVTSLSTRALPANCPFQCMGTKILPLSCRSVSNARTDGGILYFKEGPVALVVLTNENEDKSWTADNAGNKFCAEMAKAVVEHYQSKAKGKEKK